MKKILSILLLFCTCLTVASQNIDNGVYQGFKVGKGNKNNPDIINIRANSLSGGVYRFSEGKDKPLNGCYHIIIHRNKYIVANISKGVLEGEWTMYSNGDNIVEKAIFKNGCYDGELVRTYSDSETYSFRNCELQHYIAYHSNGQLKVERTYENGELHGGVKEYDKAGELIKELNFANGKKHGKQLEVSSNGYSTISNYNNDVQIGEFLYKFGNGNVAKRGEYDSNGKKTGKWIDNRENGNPHEETNYKDGEYHGEVKKYTNGKLYHLEEYANGKRHGKDITYYEYPVVREERNYINGERDGAEKYYNNKGELQTEYYYQNGARLSRKEYMSGHGDVGYTESFYQIDKRTGQGNASTSNYIIKEKHYDRNGKLKSLSLRNEKGDMVVVQEYNTAGRVVKTNKDYKKHASITLKEDASGIIDIE